MNTQKKHEEQVLESARNLIHNADVQRKLVPAVQEYVRATSRLPVSKLEYWERAFRHEIGMALYSRFRLSSMRNRSVLLPWLDYCNGNGYQREKALRTSESAPNGFLFALALRRLNDWVPQVRLAAREHVPLMAVHTKTEHIVDALWAVLPHLHSWNRLQTEDLNVITSLSSVEGVPSQLRARLIEVTAGPVATILGQIGRTSVIDECLPDISKHAVQPAVRAKAYRSQLEERMVWFEGHKWIWTDIRWCKGRNEKIFGARKIQVSRSFLATLESAAKDNSPLVRRIAGDALIKKLDTLGTDAVPIAEILARDHYPSIAERGKFVLKRIES